MTTLQQAFAMAKLTHHRPKPPRHVWTDTPEIRLTTPSAPEARAIMRQFLDMRTRPQPGHTVALSDFATLFIRCVDRELGPAQSIWWSQGRRVRRVLTDLGLQVGYWMPLRVATLVIANLDMSISRQACQTAIHLEYDAFDLGLMLMPKDYTEN
jgi:hypothetical protein